MKKEITKKHRNDIILIVCVLFVATVGIVYLNFFRSTGDTVTVTVDGTEYGVYPLAQDRTEDIYSGEDNLNHNRLVISDGKAYMGCASCPDGICVAHKPVYRDGESIICLPNRVVVTVAVDGEADTPDIIM
ncbi:MAG: NusG domain II-containing protein [Ruminococcaceae bacterium]|nr:NusG domain II-containing protein [Oscillospiraceae bacterium]